MEPESLALQIHRRTFLRYGISGLGLVALNSLLDARPRLLASEAALGTQGSQGAVDPLHHPAKAKRVIFLYQAGGPSHLETFDYKPKLAEMNSKPMPAPSSGESQARYLSLSGGRPIAPRDVRLQAQARRDEQQTDARVLDQGATAGPAAGPVTGLLWTAARVPQVWQVGARDLRVVSTHRQRRG